MKRKLEALRDSEGRRTGIVLVTLAPERVRAGFIAALARAGVGVSLGHSMATYAQTKAALAEGLTGFTHLFNAMRPLASREPGPIAAALETPGCWFGMIVDGQHVDPAILRLALRGVARPMLVTDAMPPVGGSSSRFKLCGHEIMVRDGRCMREEPAEFLGLGHKLGASLRVTAPIWSPSILLTLKCWRCGWPVKLRVESIRFWPVVFGSA